MQITDVPVGDFLATVSERRQTEAQTMMDMMGDITGLSPKMWGPSIIGYGSMHYRYESGREGDMPILAFSPRKAKFTVYFEGFEAYGDQLSHLGKHTLGVGCLYINKLADVDLSVLREMLQLSWERNAAQPKKPQSVEEYIANIPVQAREGFDELRALMHTLLPEAEEVLSYGIVGYKTDRKRARVFISGWKDHLGIYPMPKDAALQKELKPYLHGKSSIWLPLDEPLPKDLIVRVVKSLIE